MTIKTLAIDDFSPSKLKGQRRVKCRINNRIIHVSVGLTIHSNKYEAKRDDGCFHTSHSLCV